MGEWKEWALQLHLDSSASSVIRRRGPHEFYGCWFLHMRMRVWNALGEGCFKGEVRSYWLRSPRQHGRGGFSESKASGGAGQRQERAQSQFPARTHPIFSLTAEMRQTVGVHQEAAKGVLNTEKLQGSRRWRPAQGRPGHGRALCKHFLSRFGSVRTGRQHA